MPSTDHPRLSTGVHAPVPEELQSIPPLGVDVLLRIVLPLVAIVITAVLVFGCAPMTSTGTVKRAVTGGHVALGVLRESSAGVVELHAAGVSAAIAHCRATVPSDATPAERDTCLASVGFSPDQIAQHQLALEQLAAAYDSIADALAEVDAAWTTLAPMVTHAQAVAGR